MPDAQARQQLLDDGYLVVPNAVPLALCQRVVNVIESFCADAIARDPGRFDGLGVAPLHHHKVLWEVRQHPRIYEIFRALYQQDELWVTMDRIGYKLPHSTHSQAAFHWDCDPWTTKTFSLQGLIYLTDTAEDQGAFTCVPSIYRNLDAWLDAHEHDEHRRHPDIGDEPQVRVPAPAGSLVIFHHHMPHTNAVNTSDKPRLAQYVSMHPVRSEKEREVRIRDFTGKRPPQWALNQKVPGQQNPEPGEPATLTDLGKKLVGLERW